MGDKLLYGRELPGHPFNARALVTRGIIVAQRTVFSRWLRSVSLHAPLDPDCSGEAAGDAVHALLMRDAPCMVARFGTGEMETTLRHLDISLPGSPLVKSLQLLTGRIGPFWWDNSIRAGISWIAGLFPPTDEMMDRFGARMLEDCREIDLLAGWVTGEKRLHALFFPAAKCIPLPDLEPFFAASPWSRALAGKTVLAVHPFETTIRRQFEKRDRLFKDPRVLPPFELKTYRTVQSIAGNRTPFKTWFDALDHMCEAISAIDFDVALIGAGAYGMPLAAHIKRMGKKAVHMGGATQLMFGIKGGRWDHTPKYSEGLYNEHWSRPLPDECPGNFKTVEGGSYW